MDHWDEENKVAWTHTWYGRGLPIDAETAETRVRVAWRIAREKLTGAIWFDADEDGYFGGDETIEQLQPRIVWGERFASSEEEALQVWWNMYGSADTEADLRELGFGPWIEKYGRGMMEE